MSSEAVWNVPEPLSVHEVPVDGGARVVLRRHGNPNGTRLVLSHGVGLSIDLYYPFWSQLADDFDLVVYDLRSHGWNPVAPTAPATNCGARASTRTGSSPTPAPTLCWSTSSRSPAPPR